MSGSRLLCGILSLLLAGCSGASSPSSPSATLTSLTLTEESVVVPRNQTARIGATAFYSDGTTRDVTDTAVWTANAPVVEVARGLIVARGIGRSEVRADFGGKSATAAVVARRNTSLSGTVRISCSPGLSIINGLEAFIDGRLVRRVGYQSDLSGTQSESVGFVAVGVDPGVHALKVDVSRIVASTAPVSASPSPVVTVEDADTGEVLERITLANQDLAGRSVAFVWSLEVRQFSE